MARKDELVIHSELFMVTIVIVGDKAYATLVDKRTGLVTHSPRIGH